MNAADMNIYPAEFPAGSVPEWLTRRSFQEVRCIMLTAAWRVVDNGCPSWKKKDNTCHWQTMTEDNSLFRRCNTLNDVTHVHANF